MADLAAGRSREVQLWLFGVPKLVTPKSSLSEYGTGAVVVPLPFADRPANPSLSRLPADNHAAGD